MAREVSVSSSEGRVAEWHDTIKEDGQRLTGVPRNADAALSKYNEHWIGEYKTDGEKFDEIFQDAVDEFNSRQNRPSKKMGPESTNPERQKTYYEGIKDGTWCNGHDETQERAVYEAVLQIGNKDDVGTTDADFDIKKWYSLKESGREDEASAYALAHLNQSEDAKRIKRIIRKAVDRIAALDPEHLIVLRADWHGDEPCGTPNCHIAFSFRATGYKSGMKERCASVRALDQMGFKKSKEKGYGIEQLHERFKEIIAEEMVADAKEFQYEDDALLRAPDSGEHRKRSDVTVYREMAAEREALDKTIEQAIAQAQQIVSDAEVEAESVRRDADRKAEKKRIAAEAEYDQIVQQADEIIEWKNQEADVEIENKKRKADAEIRDKKREADAEIEKKKKADVEAAKSYVTMLSQELTHLCERTGTDYPEKFRKSGGTMKEYQEAIEAEFQVLEDALDAQHRVEMDKALEMQNHAFKAKLQYENLFRDASISIDQAQSIRKKYKEREERALDHFNSISEATDDEQSKGAVSM